MTEWVQKELTALFDKTGAFYAFSKKQLEEGKKEGIEYVSCGGGLICSEGNVKILSDGFKFIFDNKIKMDMEENTKAQIIRRELINHETSYSMDYSDTVEALADYPITEEEIKTEFHNYMNYCRENDIF